MSFLTQGELPRLISTYGYAGVGGIIALESIGIPLPGEAALIAASIIAASGHTLDIWLVIAAAVTGAVLGDNAGFWVGRELGYRVVLRFGRYVHLTERRIKLGHYLFGRYGVEVVFFGRFFALLRAFAAFLAGVNCMPWPRFLVCNVAGGIVWATAYGLAAYHLGRAINRMAQPAAIGIGTAAGLAFIVGVLWLRRHQAILEDKAEAALPGPLPPVGRR